MAKSDFLKKGLAESLEQLLKTRKIDSITVSDISQEAGISRTTFYRYFSDKFELMNWAYTCYMDELSNKYRHIQCYYRLMLDQTRFFESRKDFFNKTIGYDGQNSFFFHFTMNMEEYLSRNLKLLLNHELTARDGYIIRGYAAGVYKIISEWILSGCVQSPQYITELVIEMMPESLRKNFVPTYPDFSQIYDELF